MSALTRTGLIAVAAATVMIAQEKPGYYKVPGTETQMKLHGWVEIVGGTELHGGSKDGLRKGGFWAPTEKIALDGEKTSKHTSGINAGNSRIVLESITPTSLGALKTHMRITPNGEEFDRTHTGKLQLTRAWAQMGDCLLVGLQGSLFFSNAEPETCVGSYRALGGAAAPQLRVMNKLGKNLLSFSLEDTIWAKGSGGMWDPYNSYSLVGRLDAPTGLGEFSFRAATTNYNNSDAQKFGYSVGIGSVFKFGNDKLTVDVAGGAGMGTFMQGMGPGQSLIQNFNTNNLRLWKSAGATVCYTHAWTSTVRSNLFGSYVLVKRDESLMRDAISTNLAKHKKELDEFKEKNSIKITQKKKDSEGKETDEVITILTKEFKGFPAPKAYEDYNKTFHSIGINTIYEPNKSMLFGLEANYNYRRTMGGSEPGKEAKIGKEANIAFDIVYRFF